MDKVRDKLSALTEDFMDGLYYNKEEYDNEMLYKEGFSNGVEQGISQGEAKRNIEIAKSMLNKNYNIKDIIEITGLTEEEITTL